MSKAELEKIVGKTLTKRRTFRRKGAFAGFSKA